MIHVSARSPLIWGYFFKELSISTFIASLVLTLLLLYGNLNRYNDELLQALSLSPILFWELLGLLVPYAFSMALPFGYSLALLFCVGKWSADRELLALDSLGFSRSSWMSPVILFAIITSLITGFMTLQIAPTARFQFEQKKNKMLWSSFDRLIGSGDEFNFEIDSSRNAKAIKSIESLVGNDIKRISLSVGHCDDDFWQNLRISLWGEGEALFCIMHAKMAEISKDFEKEIIILDLTDVDVERTESIQSSAHKDSNFIAFKRWNSPLELFLSKESSNFNNPKMISVFQLLERIHSSEDENYIYSAWKIFNKNSVLALSPLFLCPILIPFGISKGRKEASSNLFWGIIVCVGFYASGLFLADMLGRFGIGWWINGVFFLLWGCFKSNSLLKA